MTANERRLMHACYNIAQRRLKSSVWWDNRPSSQLCRECGMDVTDADTLTHFRVCPVFSVELAKAVLDG